MAMEFNTVDPILEAFNLITDLKKVREPCSAIFSCSFLNGIVLQIGNVEQEVKDDYEKLIQNLQEFSGEILGVLTKIHLMNQCALTMQSLKTYIYDFIRDVSR